MEVVLAELAAVVACGNAQDVRRSGCRVETATQSGLHGIEAQTVDHDFVDRVASGG